VEVLVFAKWSNNRTQILTFLVKLKGVVLHAYIKLAEKFIAFALTQDVSNDR
jgi:hypothetical protein